MAAQKFTLPTMPFHREVHNGCSIGTSIIVKARAFQDQSKSFTLQLSSAKDIALQIVVPINKQSSLKMSARLGDQFTSEVEKPVYVPYNQPFTLHVRIDTHVCEVYYNDSHLGDFVHRVNPLLIKEVSLEGPLMVDEVVFRPPQGASLAEVPSYDEVAKSSIPVQELASMRITGPTSALPAAAPPSAFPVLQPTPAPSAAPIGPLSAPYTSAAPIGPPPAGTVIPPKSAPYPEANQPSAAPALPPKKKDIESTIPKPPPYIPQNQAPYPPPSQIAQVAPQPVAPTAVSEAGMQKTPTGYYPQNAQAPPGATVYPQQPQATYPSAPPAGPSAYPPAPNQYPGQPGYPGGAPGQMNTYPGPGQAPMNTYPGPNGPPPPQMYQPQYPGTSAATYVPPPMVYPQQQTVVYPQQYPTYIAPTYPAYGYGYPSVYYDDCHHHHHHC